MEESFLTVTEIASILKLNQQTVRNWIDAGTLPAIRVGRRVRIKRSDFDRLIEQGSIGGTTGAEVTATIWDGEIPPPDIPRQLSPGRRAWAQPATYPREARVSR